MALTVKIRADASHFKKTIAGIEVQASGLTGVMAKLGGSIPVMTAALTAAAVAAASLGAGVAFLKSSSEAAAGMESLTMQFEVLTGSAEKAKGLIKTFRDEAVKSPLNVKDYADAARGFMSYGVAAEKTLPILKMLGDVSMGNAERFSLLSYAMAQVASNTTLKGDDLRQLVAQGFNPLAIISEKTKISMHNLRKEMEDGNITFAMVESALKQVTTQGGRFFGAIEKGAATTEGKIAKLGDSVLGLKVALGTGFNEGLKSALDSASGFLPKLEAKFSAVGVTLGNALRKAASGNLEAFVLIGSTIGEAFARGFQDVAGNLITSGLRGILRSGSGDLSPEKREAMERDINRILGPERRPQERAMDIADELRGNVIGIQKASAPESWGVILQRQIEQTEKQIQIAKESKAALDKIAGDPNKQVIFSR